MSERRIVTRTIQRYDSTVPAQALGDVPAVVLALVALAWVYRRRLEGGPPEEVVFVEEVAGSPTDTPGPTDAVP